MIPIETWVAYTAASILIILAPGPDNILAISRGLSQGRTAACLSSVGAGCGLTARVFAATFGLTVLIQTSVLAFSFVKFFGAVYLVWLGIKTIRSRELITFSLNHHRATKSVFVSGLLTCLINPKPALFILAFIPQFVSTERGSVELQTLILGFWLTILAVCIFSLMGIFSSIMARWLISRPRVIAGLNIGAGATFISAGLSIAFLERNQLPCRWSN